MLPDKTLTDFPNEILFHIFSFIDVPVLLNGVSKVCEHFNILLSPNSNYWKLRLHERFSDPYPIVEGHDGISYPEACEARETVHHLWKEGHNQQKHFTGRFYGYAVHAVKISKDGRLCFAGCADKTIMMWNMEDAITVDLDKVQRNTSVKYPDPINLFGHNGWIWSLENSPTKNELCSTSFDCTVKIWDIDRCYQHERDKMIKDSVYTMPVKSPSLCCKYFDQNTIAVGLNNKNVIILDTRTRTISQRNVYHQSSVLKMAVEENKVITCSEDKQIVVYDIRNEQVITKICLNNFAMSMDNHRDQLWIGDKTGIVKVLRKDANSNLELVKEFDFDHCGKITGVHYDKGAIYSCGTGGYFKINEPTINSECIRSISMKPVESFDFHDKTMALATAQGMVTIWTL